MLSNTFLLLKKAAIRQKWMLAVTFFVLIVFALILLQANQYTARRSLAEQEERSSILLHAVEDSVIRSFQSVNTSLLALSEGLPRLTDNTQITALIQDQLRASPQLRSLDLLDPAGLILASATGRKGSRLSYTCIRHLKQNPLDEFYIGSPVRGRYPTDPFADVSERQHIPFCLPVRGLSGQLEYILLAAVNPQYFRNLFNSISSSAGAWMQLYRYDAVPLVAAGPKPDLSALTRMLAESGWGQYRSAVGGQAVLVSYRSTSLLPLIAVLITEDAAALQSWQEDQQLLLFSFLLFSALVVLALAVIIILLEKRHQAEGDLRLLSTAIRNTANAVFITDRQGNIHWVNRAFSVLTGYRQDEVKGKNPRFLNSGQHDNALFTAFWQRILSGKSWRGELINRHKSGQLMTVEQTVTPIFDKQGVIEHFVAVHEDVTARKDAEQRALFLADHDALTDLPNRRYFEQALQKLFCQSGESLTIFFIDLDRFKEINDTLGHEAGDALLIHTAQHLKRVLSRQHLLARIGGDEFALLTRGAQNDKSLSQLAYRVIAAVCEPFHYAEAVFNITCSIGIAQGEAGQSDASMMLRQADMAMYRAKHEGKNTFRFFDDTMDALMKRRVYLLQALEQAPLQKQALSLRFQPQVDAATGHLYGAEALLRWQTQDGEWVPPDEFINLAEESGQIVALGIWLIDALFARIADWNQRGIKTGRISMNISAVQLARDTLAERVIRRMRALQIAPEQLCIEITETTLMTDSERVADNLRQLKQAGIALSIDDFGTGYSSLSYLKAIDADHLKIDRCFIVGIGKERSDEHIVKATVALAHSLNLDVVAEGVDSPQQLAFLQALSCDYIQGYLFARPLTAPAFEAFAQKSCPDPDRRSVITDFSG